MQGVCAILQTCAYAKPRVRTMLGCSLSLFHGTQCQSQIALLVGSYWEELQLTEQMMLSLSAWHLCVKPSQIQMAGTRLQHSRELQLKCSQQKLALQNV